MANRTRIILGIVLTIVVGTICLFCLSAVVDTKVLVLSHQDSGAVYLEKEVKAHDRLTFNWIHSFEHIPWIEEYTIEDDNTVILHTIRVAGFGAGIPEDKGTVSFEDGMVVMSDIGEKFEKFSWIHSQTALVSITLNDSILIRGPELPHHEKLELTIQGKRALCPRFPLTR